MGELSQEMIILIVAVCVLFVAVAILTIGLIFACRTVKRMRSTDVEVEKVKVIDGVRYTKDEVVERNGELNVTHNLGDITLICGQEYEVRKDGKIIPGKYQILTAAGSAEVFNIRIGTFVREYTHNTPVVLAEGDKICAVSHTIVLR